MRLFLNILFLLFVQVGLAAPLKNIVMFGDSLSDSGNLYEYMRGEFPRSPPYYTGRFSNGPVWIEQLVTDMLHLNAQTALLNYAFGGAGVTVDTEDDEVLFTLNREIDTYLLAHADRADPDSMFIVWIGGNNYLGLPEDIEPITTDVTRGIQKGLKKLLDAGAKHITLMSLPDLGKTPLAVELGSEQAFRDISMLHNKKLVSLLSELKQSFPSTQWIYFDSNGIFTDIFAHPEKYPFDYFKETCSDTLPPQDQGIKLERVSLLKLTTLTRLKQGMMGEENLACDRFFFFDLIHPTTQVHKLLAMNLYQLFKQEQVTFEASSH